MGTNNISTGINSLASGFENEATGYYSFAVGYQNIAFGSHSIAMGKTATAYGIQSLAIGLLSEALGNASMAVGAYTKTTEAALLSIAFGSRVTAAAERSMTIGFGISDNPIVNIVSNSLMIGFESNLPTLFIGPSGGMGKTGKVGIGNITSPTAKLHVRADAGDSATLRLEPGSGKVSRIYFTNTNDYYVQAASNQNMVFNTLTGNHYEFKNGTLRGVNGTAQTPTYAFSSNNYNTGMYLPSTSTIAFSTNAAERLRITNAGNVGIGVTSPTEKLEVAGFAKTTSGYKVGSSVVINASRDYTGGSGTFSGNLTVTGTGNSSFTGNVGIGTSPTEKLEVVGWAKTSNGYKVGASPVIDINRNYSGNNGTFVGALAVSGTSTLNGNVGIGNSPNSNKLSVNGTVQATSFSGDGTGLTNVRDNLGNHTATQNIKLAGKWLSGDGDNEGIFISSDGKIGMGTSSPGAQLELADFGNPGSKNLEIGNDVYLSDIDEANTLGIYGNQDNTIGAIILGSNGPKLLGFAGNLGIGTTPSNGYKLSVAGKIRCTEIMVEALPWSDYVFDKGYNLMPIKELELYILTNKHLPDIPDEKTVSEQGLSIGEMNAQLLRKVEELTLYIIEQQKVLENQQNEIEKIRAMISK
jgi:hypothetical protein